MCITNTIVLLIGIDRAIAIIVLFTNFTGFHLETTVLLILIKLINNKTNRINCQNT